VCRLLIVFVPQALTRKAAVELKKDDRRPISEPSMTNSIYAPHAANSEIGLAEAAWTPHHSPAGNDAPCALFLLTVLVLILFVAVFDQIPLVLKRKN
jgi:hypothetical protein